MNESKYNSKEVFLLFLPLILIILKIIAINISWVNARAFIAVDIVYRILFIPFSLIPIIFYIVKTKPLGRVMGVMVCVMVSIAVINCLTNIHLPHHKEKMEIVAKVESGEYTDKEQAVYEYGEIYSIAEKQVIFYDDAPVFFQKREFIYSKMVETFENDPYTEYRMISSNWCEVIHNNLSR